MSSVGTTGEWLKYSPPFSGSHACYRHCFLKEWDRGRAESELSPRPEGTRGKGEAAKLRTCLSNAGRAGPEELNRKGGSLTKGIGERGPDVNKYGAQTMPETCFHVGATPSVLVSASGPPCSDYHHGHRTPDILHPLKPAPATRRDPCFAAVSMAAGATTG